jgi:thiazole synthase
MAEKVTIVVNGEDREIEPGQSLEALLRSLDLDPRAVVVERNRVIVRRPALADTTVEEGDQLELVHFVGGG